MRELSSRSVPHAPAEASGRRVLPGPIPASATAVLGLLGLSVALLSLAAACTEDAYDRKRVDGSGNVVSEVRGLGDYQRVQLAGEGRLLFGAGSEGVVEVETDDNLMDLVETDVRGGELVIRTRENTDIGPSEEIVYRLGCPELTQARILGAGVIELADCTTRDRLELGLMGAGTIVATELAVDGLTVTMTGAGEIQAAGVAEELTVTVPGAATFAGGDLAGSRVEVDSPGAGTVTVWARDQLDISITGAGVVAYYGNPTLTQQVTGVGEVESLGNK